MKVSNEIAVSVDDSLVPRPERLVGLRHGVPVKVAHQRLHVLDQVLVFIVRLCIVL
jgi:hypothetical protein